MGPQDLIMSKELTRSSRQANSLISIKNKKPGKRTGQETLRVYEYLREQILTGKLPSGAHLGQIAIATSLGTSNGPVITALRKLHYEGLVSHSRGQGCIVAKWSPAVLEDQLVVRRALETEAARLAARRVGKEDIETLAEMIERMSAFVRQGKIQEAQNLDWEFHVTIAKLTRSQALQDALEKCQLMEMIRKRETSNQTKEELAQWVQNHQVLLGAIASGNSDEAGMAMHKYLNSKK